VMLHWGLIPFWADDPKVGYRTIDAHRRSGRPDPPLIVRNKIVLLRPKI
jgi:hypothetical protein